MHQNYYEFIFKLRSSEFSHHTPEKVVEMFFDQLSKATDKMASTKQFFETLDGESGFFSNNDLTNLKYTLAGTSYLLSAFAIEHGMDSEYAYCTGDYYIQRLEAIKSYKQLIALFDEMCERYRVLFNSHRIAAYEYPISKCIHFVSQNLFSSITVKQVAEYMNMTPEYLTTIFKSATGESLYQFILRHKIEEAKTALSRTSAPIVSIAGALGFNSESHFSGFFKKKTGLSPRQYRKTYNKASFW